MVRHHSNRGVTTLSHATVSAKEVLKLLVAADGTNRDPEARRNATSRLKEVQRMGGYMEAVVEIWKQATDSTMRHLAVIQLKNNARWYWGKNAHERIANIDVEREKVRALLVQGFIKEENFYIAQQVALCLAKIAKHEWQKKNVSLLKKVNEMLGHKPYAFKGCLLAHEIFSEVRYTKNELESEKFYEEVSDSVLVALIPIWKHACDTFVSRLGKLVEGNCSFDAVSTTLVLLKFANAAVKKIIIFQKRKLEGFASNFLTDLKQLLDVVGLKIYPKIPSNNSQLISLKEKMKDVLEDSVELVLETQRLFPFAFVRHLELFLDFAKVIIGDSDHPRVMTTFGFQLLHTIYNANVYRHKPRGDKRKPLKPIQRHQFENAANTLERFFTTDTIVKLSQVMISRYLVLTKEDIDHWNEDPEDFFQESLVTYSHNGVRFVCAKFLNSLLRRRRTMLAPKVVSWFKNSLRADATSERAAIEREALYHAVGLGYDELVDELHHPDFGFDLVKFYKNALRPDMTTSSYNFLCRRAIWMIKEVKVDLVHYSTTTSHALQTVTNILCKHTDIVVRMQCVVTLAKILEYPQFDRSTYMVDPSEACAGLLKLLNELSSVQCIRLVIDVFTNILRTYGKEVTIEAAGSLCQLMQRMWGSFKDDLVRASVLGLLVPIVKAMKHKSIRFHSFLLPVLETATNPQTTSQALCETGVELWITVIQYTSQLSPDLLKLFQRWVFLMNHNADLYNKCIQLFRSYLLLGQLEFLQEYHQPILQILTGVVKRLDEEGMTILAEAISNFLQLFPQKSVIFLQPVLEQIITQFVDGARNNPKETLPYLTILGRLFFENFEGGVRLVRNFEKNQSRLILNDMLLEYTKGIEDIRLPLFQRVCLLALTKFFKLDLPKSVFHKIIPTLFVCAVKFNKPSALASQDADRFGAPLTEPQRKLHLTLIDKSLSKNLKKDAREAATTALKRIGKHQFSKCLERIPNRVLDEFHF